MTLNLNVEAKITQVIEVYNEDTHESEFLMEKDNEWLPISQKEYYKMIGENND